MAKHRMIDGMPSFTKIWGVIVRDQGAKHAVDRTTAGKGGQSAPFVIVDEMAQYWSGSMSTHEGYDPPHTYRPGDPRDF